MVERCVCFSKTFAELKIISQKNNCKTLSELKKIILFGENCGLCLPYVKMMLETGETSFPVSNLGF